MGYSTQFYQWAAILKASSAGTISATTATGTSGVPVTANVSYTAFAYFLAVSTSRTCTVGIAWYTSTGSLISTSTSAGSADNTAAWIQVVETATAPSTAAYAAIIVSAASATLNEQHIFDNVSFAITSEFSTSYFIPGAGPGGVHTLSTITYNADGSLATASNNNTYVAPWAAWSATTIYAVGATVSYNGVNYVSQASNNIGNSPGVSATYWIPAV